MSTTAAPGPNPAASPTLASVDQEIDAIEKQGSYHVALAFETAVDMLAVFDKNIGNGTIKLHDWQIETLQFLCQSGKFTKQAPLKFLLRAANGSGKDAFVIAPFAVWFILTKVRSRVIITSASHQQLSAQTEVYIKNLCNTINRAALEQGQEEVFLTKRQYIYCKATGSEIRLFATDEPGKAEGYHPWPDAPNAELCIIVNEAKSVTDNIFDALSRCTYTHCLFVTSPGHRAGRFYNEDKRARWWKDGCLPGFPFKRKVTSFDCQHISPLKIAEDKESLGENHPVFQSKHLAEFTDTEDSVVISREWIDKNNAIASVINKGGERYAGVDLAGGGDENCIVVIEDNKVIACHAFRNIDTDETASILVEHFKNYALKPSNIFADDGGIGQGILDNIRGRGWSVGRVRNQSSPLRSKAYGNRGAELWFNVRRFIELCLLVLPANDSKLINQLASRGYRQQAMTGKLILESKEEARTHGRPSPDRADALALALSALTVYDFVDPDKRAKMLGMSGNYNATDKSLGVKSNKVLRQNSLESIREQMRVESLNSKQLPVYSDLNRDLKFQYLTSPATKQSTHNSSPTKAYRKLIYGSTREK